MVIRTNGKQSIYALIALMIISFQCTAQQEPFSYYGHVAPHQITFRGDTNLALFHQYLTSFVVQGKKDVFSTYVGVFDEQSKTELDSNYWQYVFMVPGFKVFPAFKIDCMDGYLIGLYLAFHSYKATKYNLDIVSYDTEGRIVERTTFPLLQIGFYPTQDSCIIAYHSLGGLLCIDKGVLTYKYESSRFCTPEMVNGVLYEHEALDVEKESKQYIYKIGDNACLIPVSESNVDAIHQMGFK